jgi:hypothetical protein
MPPLSLNIAGNPKRIYLSRLRSYLDSHNQEGGER